MKTTIQNESYSGWNTWSVRNAETGKIITQHITETTAKEIQKGLKHDGNFFQKFTFCFYNRKYSNAYNFISFCTRGYEYALNILMQTINTENCDYYLMKID